MTHIEEKLERYMRQARFEDYDTAIRRAFLHGLDVGLMEKSGEDSLELVSKLLAKLEKLDDRREYWNDKTGKPVHVGLIKDDEKLKDAVVKSIATLAMAQSDNLSRLKGMIESDIMTHMDILREKYGIETKTRKGNLTLTSFDGLVRVQVSVAESIGFSEKIVLAKEKLDVFIKSETQHATPIVKQLLENTFEVDKKGEISRAKIFGLLRHEVDHPMWNEAMGLIKESIEVSGSKSYTRVYIKDHIEAAWQIIPLNIADVGGA